MDDADDLFAYADARAEAAVPEDVPSPRGGEGLAPWSAERVVGDDGEVVPAPLSDATLAAPGLTGDTRFRPVWRIPSPTLPRKRERGNEGFAARPPARGEESGRGNAAVATTIAGADVWLLPEGAMWLAAERALIVSDLHLEKGSSFARRGELLPPYDTIATLAALAAVIALCDPAVVIALGDSFHDDGGPARLSPSSRAALAALQHGRDWIWIAGNHDRAAPADLRGRATPEFRLGALTFRHEPRVAPADGEIAGHLHPAGRVAGRSGSVRRRCFVGDGTRLVMPAFGAYAGGLNVLDAAFRFLFAGAFTAFVLGRDAVYPVHRRSLVAG